MSTSEERIAGVIRRAKLETASRDVISFGIAPLWFALLSIVSVFFKLGSDRIHLRGSGIDNSVDGVSKKRED